MKKSLLALVFALALIFTACGNKPADNSQAGSEQAKSEASKASEAATAEKPVKLKIGVSPVPHAEIVEAIKDNLAKRGVELEIVNFDDYVQPNHALASGEIDANFFQHEPYLDAFKKENNLKLTNIGAVHLEPMAVYSDKLKSLDEVPEGGKVLIPNDVSNGARALLLLAKNNLIKLDDPSNINVTEKNITENPKKLTFVPMEAAALARAYKDADLAVINSNFALGAGLNPLKDNLAIEDKDSPYVNIVVVREGEENEEKFKILMEELNSETVKKFINDKYQGAVIPAF